MITNVQKGNPKMKRGQPVVKYQYVPRSVRFALVSLYSLGLITIGVALGIVIAVLKPGVDELAQTKQQLEIPALITETGVVIKTYDDAQPPSFQEFGDDVFTSNTVDMDPFGDLSSGGEDKVSVIPMPVTKVNWEYDDFDKEIECLAQNIYFEAHTESRKGQLAVGHVTINRVLSKTYPNSICEVVWQKARNPKTGKMVAQFSWTWDGKKDIPVNKTAYEEAHMLAEAFLAERSLFNIADFTEGATHYHATYVKPWWRRHFTKVVEVDTHIFYRDEKRTPRREHIIIHNPVVTINNEGV